MAQLHGDTVSAVEKRRLERDVGIGGVVLVYPSLLSLDGFLREGAVKLAQHIGKNRGKAVVNGRDSGDEQPGVPQKLPALDEHLGKLPLRLLDERVDLEYRRLVGRRVADVAYLQIAVARLRTGGAYAHREEALLFRGMVHRLQHIVAECSLVGDELVGGCDDKRGGGVDVLDAVGGPCRNGSGVATDRLAEQTTRRKLGQLSSDH